MELFAFLINFKFNFDSFAKCDFALHFSTLSESPTGGGSGSGKLSYLSFRSSIFLHLPEILQNVIKYIEVDLLNYFRFIRIETRRENRLRIQSKFREMAPGTLRFAHVCQAITKRVMTNRGDIKFTASPIPYPVVGGNNTFFPIKPIDYYFISSSFLPNSILPPPPRTVVTNFIPGDE